jgi:uncharacterized membrane protein (DUF373 family)
MDASAILKTYEKIIYFILITLFSLIVAFSVGELAYIVYMSLFVNTPLLLENQELLGIFGYFLLVLIGVELLSTVAAYVNEKVVHVEVVILIAIIAVVRSVILVDPGKLDGSELTGVAAIIITLCAGYYLLKKGGLGRLSGQYNSRNSHPVRSYAALNPLPGRQAISKPWQMIRKKTK